MYYNLKHFLARRCAPWENWKEASPTTKSLPTAKIPNAKVASNIEEIFIIILVHVFEKLWILYIFNANTKLSFSPCCLTVLWFSLFFGFFVLSVIADKINDGNGDTLRSEWMNPRDLWIKLRHIQQNLHVLCNTKSGYPNYRVLLS